MRPSRPKDFEELVRQQEREIERLRRAIGGGIPRYSSDADPNTLVFRDGDGFAAIAGGALQTYTPVLTAVTTNPSLGSGGDFTQSGRYWLLPGGIVEVDILLRFGSSGVSLGSGTYIISLPVAADVTFHRAVNNIGLASTIGVGVVRDNSNVAASIPVTAFLRASGDVVSVNLASGGLLSNSLPTWPLAASDAIQLSLRYRHV